MVLQQNSNVTFRGTAVPGSRITVKAGWIAKKSTVTTDAQGRWFSTVQTPAFGGPYSVTFTGDGVKEKSSVTLKDILVGEVWLCSGQSNMEMPVRG